jgi:hypothetical protein
VITNGLTPPDPGMRSIEKGRHLYDIGVRLNDYDDIFSGSDTRPYQERIISDDFLYKIKRLSRENHSEVTSIGILVPEENRDIQSEKIITERLHRHFKKTYRYLKSRSMFERKRAVLQILAGLTILSIAFYISSLHTEELMLQLFFVIMEPAGCFIAWTGLEILFTSGSKLQFYSRLKGSEIVFDHIR